MVKKLSVAFIWHLHQPDYKDPETKQYLMPWVRLHAIKDYLDMLLLLDEFPKIRQTFNIVPLLIDQLDDYANNDAHDLHSALTVKPVESLTKEDKIFILNSFFDANYDSMIATNEPYKVLYEKRFSAEKLDINSFSNQEYSDLMFWFNMVWFDPYWVNNSKELKNLYCKGAGYTIEDRLRLIEMQREIIRQILPAYKDRFEKGQIEISTSPYYHPILPLVLDTNCAAKDLPSATMPKYRYGYEEDFVFQMEKSIDKFEKVFGQKPKGIWPPEHCISNDTVKLFQKMGFKWTVSDEGVLAKSLGKEFVRNFDGILKNPYDLCNIYCYGEKNDDFNIVFRNSYFANLISFQYGAHDAKVAANDLYERIKTAQVKLNSSPDDNHLITIAMDGENCWEVYQEDGSLFLRELYKLLSQDDSLDITTVSDYISKINKRYPIKEIHHGSWVGRNFGMWIGEPIKNLAWEYLYEVRKDLVEFSKEKHSKKDLEKAWTEFHVALGSDWQWWFGEPNDSGQDELFDLLFRKHLARVYKLLGKIVPEFLQKSLNETIYGSLASSKVSLSKVDDIEEDSWLDASSCILAPDGPVFNADKLVKQVCYGCDENNIYLSFCVNDTVLEDVQSNNLLGQIFIYFQGLNNHDTASHIRAKATKDNPSKILKYSYSHEIEIPIIQNSVMPIAFSRSIENFLWEIVLRHNIKFKYDKVIEVAVPFESLNIKKGKQVNITLLTGKSSIIDEVITPNKPISIVRP